MSTPNTPEEPPRFGQRSPGWTPEPGEPDQSGTPGGSPWGQYGTRPGQSSTGTPWPRYGETAPQAGPAAAPQTPPFDQYRQTPGSMPGPQGWPYATPGPVSGPLPSRAGAVVLVVVGVVVATVIAFATFIGVALAGMNFQEVMDSATPVANGDTVHVDATGTYLVVDSQGGDLSCDLRPSSGAPISLEETSGYSSMVMGSDIPAGAYTLSCETTGNSSLVGMTGVDASQLTGAVMRGFGWGTLLGILGIAMVIAGIVWLVRINRRRSDIQRQSWQMGPGRY